MARTRIQTYFGIPLPPWPDQKMGAGTHTIWFVIKGRVPSKKNNQQAIARRDEAVKYLNELFRTKKTITREEAFNAVNKVSGQMRGNDRYKKFLEEQQPAIAEQRSFWEQRYGPKGLIFPLSNATMGIRFYFAETYRQDSVNKQQSVQDLLKDCLIIQDDDYTIINPITAAGACFHQQITHNLTYVSLTFRL